MKNFNLIISTHRFNEEEVADEMLDFLEDFGDNEAEAEISNVSGLVVCKTLLDPFLVVEKLAHLIRDESWRIRYILRVIPIEVVVLTKPMEIAQAASKLCQTKMTHTDAYRITVEKRHCDVLSSKEIISIVADNIQNKVRLEEPDWIVLIEIIGKQCGVSVLKESQIFSALKEKRA